MLLLLLLFLTVQPGQSQRVSPLLLQHQQHTELQVVSDKKGKTFSNLVAPVPPTTVSLQQNSPPTIFRSGNRWTD